MPAYGPAHVCALVVLVLAAAILIPRVRRSDPARADRVLRITGWVLLVNSALWTLWGLMPWAWDLDESLPLHLSDLLRFFGAYALISQRGWAVAVSYYWGLTLNMMSVLTPDLNYFTIPALEYVEYWAAHGAGMLIPLVLVWGRGHRPGWRSYGLAYAVSCLWAVTASIVNALAGTNYGYLHHAPAGPSLLDVLGPWPWYVLVEAGLAAVVWAAMTVPWTLGHGRAGMPGRDRADPLRRGRAVPPVRASAPHRRPTSDRRRWR
jgi:hypothetical integral membrane protein (TIGR02206 family)